MCRTHPPTAHCNRPIVDPGDAELLKSFDRSNDVDQGINRSHLMERNAI
jgi:hypothetical protein